MNAQKFFLAPKKNSTQTIQLGFFGASSISGFSIVIFTPRHGKYSFTTISFSFFRSNVANNLFLSNNNSSVINPLTFFKLFYRASKAMVKLSMPTRCLIEDLFWLRKLSVLHSAFTAKSRDLLGEVELKTILLVVFVLCV